ncbi:MAG: DUF2946 family protein [Rhodospirillaceae bacterium]
MDEIVLKGMAKWPNVPAVYGWLSLDRRGNWLLKDEKISNPTVTAFIGRNYEHDDQGRWFFQNGPQRVFVDLEYTPFVYRVTAGVSEALEFETHTGKRTHNAVSAWLDEQGVFLLETDLGIGLVDDRDLHLILNALVAASSKRFDEDDIAARLHGLELGEDAGIYLRASQANIPVCAILSRDVAKRFGFAPHPTDEAPRTTP